MPIVTNILHLCIYLCIYVFTYLFIYFITVESRFLESPRETKIGSRNREFAKSNVPSNDAKLLRYCFIRGNHANFRSNRWEMVDLLLTV